MKPKDTMSEADLPRRLKLLDKELNKLPIDSEGMILSQLEGYLAGIIICPDLIMPGEWLPVVWGGHEPDAEPAFENAKQAEKLVSLVMEHYNATVTDISAGHYTPVYDVDVRHDETLWEIWIKGFEQAMALRPQSWRTYLEGDEDTRTAMAGLLTLIEAVNNDAKPGGANIDEIHEVAATLIPRWVEMLNAARVSQYAQTMPTNVFTPAHSAKAGRPPAAGRNEPCPCGSGKKYKKCCGLN